MTDYLHWLPVTSQIPLKCISLTCEVFSGQTPIYLCGPFFATSGRPLCSLDTHGLLVLYLIVRYCTVLYLSIGIAPLVGRTINKSVRKVM